MLNRCHPVSAYAQYQTHTVWHFRTATRKVSWSPRGRSSLVKAPADRDGLARSAQGRLVRPSSPLAGQALPTGLQSQKSKLSAHGQSADSACHQLPGANSNGPTAALNGRHRHPQASPRPFACWATSRVLLAWAWLWSPLVERPCRSVSSGGPRVGENAHRAPQTVAKSQVPAATAP